MDMNWRIMKAIKIYLAVGGYLMKKSFKVIVTSLSLLAGTSVLSPVVPTFKAKSVLADTQSEVKTIGMKITKTGTNEASMAAGFIGNKAEVTISNGKITQLTIHVPNNNISSMLKSISLNGYTGKSSLSQDKSTIDYVFPAEAYKDTKGVISFTYTLGQDVTHSADITFDKVDLSTSKTSSTVTPAATTADTASQASTTAPQTTSTPQATSQAVTFSKTLDLSNAKTISLALTKTGTTTSSEAAMYLGNTAKVIMANGKVSQVVLHVNGNTPVTKGQDMTKMISEASLNGVKATLANVASDGSSFDLVFPASAYKAGKGQMSFTMNVMGHTMNVSADANLGEVAPATKKTTKKSTKKHAKKTTKKSKKRVVRRHKKTTKKSKKRVVRRHKKVVKKSKKRIVRKHTKKIRSTKRTLKHNAYAYLRNGKRANKKLLKKGHKLATYGRAIKLHGKYFYRISKTTYVKKANF